MPIVEVVGILLQQDCPLAQIMRRDLPANHDLSVGLWSGTIRRQHGIDDMLVEHGKQPRPDHVTITVIARSRRRAFSGRDPLMIVPIFVHTQYEVAGLEWHGDHGPRHFGKIFQRAQKPCDAPCLAIQRRRVMAIPQRHALVLGHPAMREPEELFAAATHLPIFNGFMAIRAYIHRSGRHIVNEIVRCQSSSAITHLTIRKHGNRICAQFH